MMKRPSIAFALASLALAVPTVSWAATATANLAITVTAAIAPGFYVAATGGSDSNSGTLAAPFATLGKCQTTMRGSTVKTCYLRAGTYTPAKVSADGFICNHPYVNAGPNAGAAVFLQAADNGETWSYYPPDGVNSAIIDGQSTVGQAGDSTHTPILGGPANGLGCIFSASGTSGITITGLKMQRAVWSGFFGNNVSNMVISNNEVTNVTGTVFNAGALVFTCGTGNTFDHNYVHDVMYMGIGAWASTGTSCRFDNTVIKNNVVANSCLWPPDAGGNDMTGADCGGIYLQDTNAGGSSTSSGMLATNNWVQDVNAPYVSNTSPLNGRIGIYLDQATSNMTETGNVVLGKMTSCFYEHGGNNNLWQYNICDVDNSTSQMIMYESATGNTAMNNNSFVNNIVVVGSSGSGGGYHADSATTSMTVTPNFYHNYVGSSVNSGGSDGQLGDPNPISGDPQLSCWSANIAGGSPVFSAPNTGVSFHDLTRGWGPPGFVFPQTGTAPSWAHAC